MYSYIHLITYFHYQFILLKIKTSQNFQNSMLLSIWQHLRKLISNWWKLLSHAWNKSCVILEMQSLTMHGTLTVLIFSVYMLCTCERYTNVRREIRYVEKICPCFWYKFDKWTKWKMFKKNKIKAQLKKRPQNSIRKLMCAILKMLYIYLIWIFMSGNFVRLLMALKSTKILSAYWKFRMLGIAITNWIWKWIVWEKEQSTV